MQDDVSYNRVKACEGPKLQQRARDHQPRSNEGGRKSVGASRLLLVLLFLLLFLLLLLLFLLLFLRALLVFLFLIAPSPAEARLSVILESMNLHSKDVPLVDCYRRAFLVEFQMTAA